MATVEVIFFREAGRKTPPIIEWLDRLSPSQRGSNGKEETIQIQGPAICL